MRYIGLILSIIALPLIGCEETGLRSFMPDDEDAGTQDASQTRDAGFELEMVRHEYTPEGCDYTVSTPEIEGQAGPSAATFGDDPTPDHIHASWAGPTDSTFAVNWRTDLSTRASVLLYGTDEGAVAAADGPADDVRQQLGHHMLVATGLARADTLTRLHEVHVCGLSPDTGYFYKVGGPGHWSDVYEFSTGPVIGSTNPWSFAATGDSRNQQENSWALSQKRLRDAAVDLQVFSGDAVFLGTLQTDWDGFFEATDGDFAVQDLFAEVPFMMANGNHDALAVNYVAQFAFPQDRTTGEQAQGEEWYSFDYANAHFVILNDSVADDSVLAGPQAQWLRADLGSVDREKTPWIFAVHHRPFYTCLSNHRPDTSLRTAWQPIFDEYRVDIVFTGHNHVYERSYPIRGLNDAEGMLAPAGAGGVPQIDGEGFASGTLYIVAAGVGAPLYGVSDECPTTNVAESLRNHVVVEIDDRTLSFTAYETIGGGTIDHFTYTK